MNNKNENKKEDKIMEERGGEWERQVREGEEEV
jgi:hypothetical protein